VHWHAPLGERERDAACADPELERASIPSEFDEEVDGGSTTAGSKRWAADSSYVAAMLSPK
jgi:hypothetical protein